jgi:hypothetical protein
MSRYVRHSPIISRQSDESIGEDHWFKQFQKSLQKDAVQPKAQQSLFDQINSIMNGNGKSKYTSVDAAVQDMQERSGLTAYLNKINKVSEETASAKKVVASDQQPAIDKKIDITPIVIKKHPQIQQTLENYINDTKGNLSIPAILDKIRSIHQSDCSDAKDWDDDKLVRLISKLNLSAKTNNPGNYNNYNNLGRQDNSANSEIDPSNTDAFFALTPAKI